MRVEPQPITPHGMRTLLVCCALTWLASIISAVLAIVRHDWLTLAPALCATICAAGWLMSAQQWAAWRLLALTAKAIMEGLPPQDWPK